jgi:drug/metabolite transporter (DMT)-like permease
MDSSILLGKLLAIGALINFTASILLLKFATKRLSLSLGFLVSVTSNVLFCIVLVGADFLIRPHHVEWKSFGFWLFLLSGFFSTYLGRWLFFETIARFGAAKASIFQVTSPAFAAVIAWIFLGERLGAVAIAGMAVTLAGLLLVSYKPGLFSRREKIAPGPGPGKLPLAALGKTALLLGSCGAASYAVGSVLRGAAVRDWNEPILGALLGAASGLVLQLAFNTNLRHVYRDLQAADRKGLILYSINGIVTITAQICTIASMRYIPVATSNLITLCTPVVIVPIAYFFMKDREGITARTWIGGTLTMVGMGILVVSK